MESFKFDPAKLSRATVVAEASAAIQKAAAGSGIQVGRFARRPREVQPGKLRRCNSRHRQSGRRARPVEHLESIGFPLVVDAVQLNTEPTKPGMVKLTLTILILDFEQWKKTEAPRA